MTTRDDIDNLAGEYVLGTLDAGERASVAARRLREPDLDKAIGDWERRLAPLDAETAPVVPPAELFGHIERRIASSYASGFSELANVRRELRRWRRIGISASAIAASLLLAIGVREFVWKPAPQTYVAVFTKDDVLPAFYMTFDLGRREMTIRPIDAQRHPGKTYQLWIASDQLGPAPQSLGLMDETLAPTTKVLSQYNHSLLQRATFGVSLEPSGGSPTGRPTSPALHAKLLPVVR
ncbi:MAG: anti-sigma factor domain-containing protein [Hyphomicrobiaceae bacterium]